MSTEQQTERALDLHSPEYARGRVAAILKMALRDSYGAPIVCAIIRDASRSGMSRTIDFYVPVSKNGYADVLWLSGHLATGFGYRRAADDKGLIIKGFPFDVLHRLGASEWGETQGFTSGNDFSLKVM